MSSSSRPHNPLTDVTGDWRPRTKLNGEKYYTKNTIVVVTKEGPEKYHDVDLVIDDWGLRRTAEDTVHTSSSLCDEIYLPSAGQSLLVFHSTHTAFFAAKTSVGPQVKNKLYWHYVANHAAHTSQAIRNILPDAHKLALVYLKWCTLEALTSSQAKVPFPLKHCQELTFMLTSLSEPPDIMVTQNSPGISPPAVRLETTEQHSGIVENLQDNAPEAGSSSQPIQLPSTEQPQLSIGTPVTDDKLISVPELAAQESRELQTALIARVLTEKYSHQDAEATTDETHHLLTPSKTLDVLFRIVNVASLGSFLRYLQRLEDIRSTILTDDQWRDHIMRMIKEWEEFNLISTVLLSASAGILALESVSGVPRTAILISILASFGSVTTGLYCISVYQIRTKEDRDTLDRTNELIIFNYNQYTSTHKGIALVLGLPMAFLVWSLIAFMTGIVSYNIVVTEASGQLSHVAVAVLAVAGFMFLLIAGAFYSLSRLWGSGTGNLLFSSVRRIFMAVFGLCWRRRERRNELYEKAGSA